MRVRVVVLAWFALLLAPLRTAVAQQVDHLEMRSTPQVVGCGAEPRAFFRASLSAVDADGKPVGIAIPKGDEALKLFDVFEDQLRHRVIYVDPTGSSSRTRDRYTILLFDTSGSMQLHVAPSKQTRFDIAKLAISKSLGNFVDGTDHFAVIPFESHNVVARISGAEFKSTRAGVEDQIAAIPTPGPKNDTALYSAVLEALPILKRHAEQGADVSLVVFTDGENDVKRPGNDRGLLGDEGLQRVRDAAADAKIPLTTVGFGIQGNRHAQDALRQMAWPNSDNFYDAATDPDRLVQIFEITRRKLTERIQILFGPVRSTMTELSGQSIRFHVRLRTGSGFVDTRSEPLWNSPGAGRAVAETQCTDAEANAIVVNGPHDGNGPPDGGSLLHRLIVFLGLAAALVALWFGAPRFMWPESYIPKPVLPNMNVPPPNVPGVSFQSPPQPRMPLPGQMVPRSPTAPPPARPRPPAPPPSPSGGETIVIPPRGGAVHPGGGQRSAPPEPEAERGGGDETVYRPPNKNPRDDR